MAALTNVRLIGVLTVVCILSLAVPNRAQGELPEASILGSYAFVGQPGTEDETVDEQVFLITHDNGLRFDSRVDLGTWSPGGVDDYGATRVSGSWGTVKLGEDDTPTLNTTIQGEATSPTGAHLGAYRSLVEFGGTQHVRYINPNISGRQEHINVSARAETVLHVAPNAPDGLISMDVSMDALTVFNGNVTNRPLLSMSVSKDSNGNIFAIGAGLQSEDLNGDGVDDQFIAGPPNFSQIQVTEGEAFAISIGVLTSFDADYEAVDVENPSFLIDFSETIELTLTGSPGGRFEIVCPGGADFDRNGSIDFADFLMLSGNFGQTGTHATGDADCNGQIEFADFLVLSGSFGQSTAGIVMVPEPNSCHFLLLLFLGLLRSTRQR